MMHPVAPGLPAGREFPIDQNVIPKPTPYEPSLAKDLRIVDRHKLIQTVIVDVMASKRVSSTMTPRRP